MVASRIQDRKRGVEYLLDPEPLRARWGEVLVLPETAEVIEDTCVWSLISYLIDLYDEDYTLTYNQLVEKAEEWLENNR